MNIQEICTEFPYFFPIVAFLFGACTGSFLNVCILRIPRGESIVRPPSHCACGKLIKWYDNIPILAWFFLRGKARCCGGKISFRYPFVELLTAVLFCTLWMILPMVNALVGMVFISILIFCTFVDIDTMELPDIATVGGTALGLILSAFLPDRHSARIEGVPFFASSIASIICAITGIAVGSGILYWLRLSAEIIFRREAMGEGDVILVGLIGAFCGWKGAVFAIFGGSLIGAILILPILAVIKLFGGKKPSNPDTAPDAIPFGPWLALGGALYYMFLKYFVDAYFASISAVLFN